MVVVLNGENSYSLQVELRKLVDSFVKKHGDLALERIDGQEADIAKLGESLTSFPFLADKKMVVLRAPSTNKQFVEQAEQFLGSLPETTDVILVEPKLDKRLGYYKYLKKSTDFREFPELDPNGLGRWMVEFAKSRGGSISQADARYLVERAGANQQLLSNELEKLLLYKPEITRQTIELLTAANPQSTIFQLLEAAFNGQSKRSMEIYSQQRSLKVEPPQIIAMLAWQLHVLAVIKTAGDRTADAIAREAKISPYVVGKSQSIARGLTLSQLKKLVAELSEIDVKIKTTNIDSDEALQNYLIKLSR